MCYEFSEWYKKARTPEQLRKDVKTDKPAPREVPAASPEQAKPVMPVAEREKAPA